MSAHALWILTWVAVAGSAVFYALIRSGLGDQVDGPNAFKIPQQIFAILLLVWTFAISGADRGAVISLMVLNSAFAMFALRPRAVIELTLFALFALAAVIAGRYWLSGSASGLRDSLFELFYATVSMLPICVMARQISRMKMALRSERKALERAMAQIRLLADSDELTGLLNRRAMLQVMQSETNKRASAAGQICVALLDIDHFKSINDRFGHQTGDEVLRLFAEIASSTLRMGDVLARWGGEEFLLLLPDTSMAQAVPCVERLRAALVPAAFGHIAPGLNVTISAGITNLHHGDRLEAAIERADQAMYRAKQAGRDRVMIGALHGQGVYAENMNSVPVDLAARRAAII
ncbi:MAG: GGDEF domain-containing protein [Acidocella sp.]|nr:GGDEF domain-containing protein [Acidocella sp.]